MNLGHSLRLTVDQDWDIQLDSHGRIVTCTGPYAIAQHVSNAIKLWTNDAYFDPQSGIPHKVVDLGIKLQPSIVISRFKSAALSVEGVAGVDVQDLKTDKRKLTCMVNLHLTDGSTAAVEAGAEVETN